MREKVCHDQRVCQTDKPQNILRFYKDKKSSDGYSAMCRRCYQQYQKDLVRNIGGIKGLKRL